MIALLGIALLGLAGLTAAVFAATRQPEEELPPLIPQEEEVIEATLRSGYVIWAALTDWVRVHTRYPNQWPVDTNISFVWTIRNIGNVGAYFQVYIFDPGNWLYLDPGNEIQVFEEFHTPLVPVIPGYQYYNIHILGRKVTGERIGAVWTSDEVEVVYV